MSTRQPATPPSEARPADAPVSTQKSMLFVYAAYLLRYVYLLVLIPYYSRVLGAQEYGRVLAAMALFQIVWMVAEYGFPTAGQRDLKGGRDPALAAREFGRQLSGRCWTSAGALLLGIAGVVASPLLNEQPAMGVLAVATGLVSAFNLGWFFSATLRFRTSVALEVLGFALNLVLILSLVHGPGDGAWVLGSLLISGTLVTLVAHGIALRQLPRQHIRIQGGLRLMHETFALFLNRSVGLVMSSAATYLLGLSASAEQVGYFGAAERLASACMSLLLPAQQVLVGTINFHLTDDEGDTPAYHLMWKAMLFYAAFGITATAGTLLVAPYIVPLILGTGFEPSIHLLRLLAPMLLLGTFSQFAAGCVLSPMRRDLLVTTVTALGAVTMLAGMLIWAPTHGADATALARVAAQAVVAVAFAWVLHREGTFQRITEHRNP